MNGLQKSPRVDHPCQAVHPSGGQDALRTQGGPSPLSFLRNACISHHESPSSAHTQKSKCIQVNPLSGVYKGVDASGRHLVQRLKGRDLGGQGGGGRPHGRPWHRAREAQAGWGSGASSRTCILALQPGM